MQINASERSRESGESPEAVKIFLCPKKVLKVLFVCIAFLLFADVLGIISRIVFNHNYCYGLIPMFDLDAETNLPTFYSSITLFLSGLLLAVITYCHKKRGEKFKAWAGLSFIFIYLALDEFSSLHERFQEPLQRLMSNSSLVEVPKVSFYAWVVPYSVLLLILAFIYGKFLIKLPRKTMIMFIISGGIYVSGAAGFEVLGGIQDVLSGQENLTYMLLVVGEEIMEMIGVALFIYTLLSYIEISFKDFSLSICTRQKADSA